MLLADRDIRRLRCAAAAADDAGMLLPVQQALLHRRGWLRMLAPRSCGGLELALPAAVRLEEELAAADGSCAWVVTLCAGAGWFAGFWPPALAREIIGTPRVCLAGSGAVSGQADRDGDGWRISGRWAHASGAPLATHFTMNAVLRDGGQPVLDAQGQPRVRAFIVPAGQVEVVPTWHSIGLRATASHAFAVHDRRVSASHAFDIDAAAATADGPLYRFPFRPLAFVTLAANLAGMARHFVELVPPAVTQGLVQRAHADLAAARQRFYALLDGAWQQVESGRVPEAEAMRRLEDASRDLATVARSVVDELYPHGGLHAADPRTELNRVWRDLHTATQHALWRL